MAEEAKRHSPKRIVIGVLLSVVAAFVLGLHFASIIRLPFLPTSEEIAFAFALDRVTSDGSFEVEAQATADVTAGARGTTLKVKAKAQASGAVREFKRDDPLAFRVADGQLLMQARPTGFALLLLREPLRVSGSFEADLPRKTMEYAIHEPLALEGSLSIDTKAFRNAPKGDLEVKSLSVEDGVATVVVSGESIAKSGAFESVMGSLAEKGLAVEASFDDVTVVVHIDEPNDRIEVAIDTSLDARVQ